MKIIAVGRNYIEHAKELNNPVPSVPVIFMKPETALLKDNAPFYYPEFSSDIHYETEIVLKICKEGKHIPEKFASNYFDEIGLGIDLTARDIQQKHKEKGLPWELAKAFDFSAPIGKFVDKSSLTNLDNLNFSLSINGENVQQGQTKDMIFSFEKLISFISSYITLKKGDLIFTGTPEGVGKINIGDKLAGFIGDDKFFDFEIK